MVAQRSISLALLLAVAFGAALQAQGSATVALTISPSRPTTQDRVVVHAAVTSTLPFSFIRVDRSGDTFTIVGGTYIVSPLPPPATYSEDLDLGVLPAGAYQVALAGSSVSFEVVQPTELLLDGRFRVSLLRGATIVSPTLVTGGEPAAAVKLSDLSGYFWFFDSANVEVTVKIIDGTPVNGHFWLFAATMTDQPFVLEVLDTSIICAVAPCRTNFYVNPAGKNQNFIDVRAFPQ